MNSITYELFCVCYALLLSWVVAVKLVYPLWLKPKKVAKFLKRQGIDGPPYKLLFGNAKDAWRMTMEAFSKPMAVSHDIVPWLMPFYHENMNRYGKIFVTWLGTTPRITITSPDLVKEIMCNKFGHFQKPILPHFVRFVATGLFTYDGDKWAVHRRIMNPSFSIENLKGKFQAFSSSCGEMIHRWEKLVVPSGSCELDVWIELEQFTADVIAKIVFGTNYTEVKRIFELQSEQSKLSMPTVKDVYIPGFRFLPTEANIRRKEVHKEVTSLLTTLINERVKEIQKGKLGKDDMLSEMVKSYVSSSNVQEDIGSKRIGIPLEEILEECTLFSSAQDTTSSLLTWTMALSMDQTWQRHARDEVLSICGRQIPTFDDLSKLKIVTMVLYETLRLYPPFIMLFRRTYKPMTVGQISFPAGIELTFPTLLIHRDREIWGDDSNEFNPQRFSEGISNASKNPASFFPFGWGPRVCIGQKFALVEAKLALSMILQHFSFELSPSYVHAPCDIITLQPRYGAHLLLKQL